MPVSAGTVQFSYTGDGTTTVFPFPSRFLTNSDIIVGVDGVQVFTGFTVTGAGDDAGGNVTFSVAPVGATAITLIRAPSINQLLDFVNNQTVLAQNIDNGLDKLTIVAQYLSYLLDRALKLDQFDTGLTGDFDVMSRRLKNIAAPVDDTDAARLSDLQDVVAGAGNVPLPTAGQVGYELKAIAENVFGWVNAGSPLAPDGTLAAPGYGFASETNTGFLRPSTGTLQAAVLGVLRAELTASAFRLLVPLLPTNGTLTAGTDAQGQGLITTDQVTITTAAANPSGATLPTAVAGRRVVVANRGANPVNIYPASGAAIGALAANAPLALAVGQSIELFARSTTQWEGQISQPLNASLTQVGGLVDPNADRILFWDDSAGAYAFLSPGAGLAISGTTLAVGGVVGPTATTSGTVVDFAIPSTATQITFVLGGVSTNGTSQVLIQLAASGYETSGYAGSNDAWQGSPNATLYGGTGFPLDRSGNPAAASVRNGVATLLKTTGNQWVLSYNGAYTNTGQMQMSVGGKTLSGSITGLRLTTVGGTDTFDLGTAIAYWS